MDHHGFHKFTHSTEWANDRKGVLKDMGSYQTLRNRNDGQPNNP
jgi:hypothetical protein